MVGEGADFLARLGVPEFADHVVGHAGDRLPIRADGELANPALVGLHFADRFMVIGIPPDQLAIVAAGDEATHGHHERGHVALMPFAFEGFELGLVGGGVDFVDLEIRTRHK